MMFGKKKQDTEQKTEESKESKPDENKDKKKEDQKQEKEKWYNKFLNREKLKKTNKTAVIFFRNNGLVDFKEVEPRDGVFHVEGHKYHVDRDCIYATQKDRIPVLAVREWDLIPIGTKKWSDDEMRNKFAKLERHVVNGIKNAELVKQGGAGLGTQLTTKQIILYAIIAIVGIAIAVNYL